jgi:hypothetical protein
LREKTAQASTQRHKLANPLFFVPLAKILHPIATTHTKRKYTMTIHKAITPGLAGEKLSRVLTGTSEVSVGRSTIATGAGAVLGGVATGAVAAGATAVGFTALAAAAAPVVVPVAVVSGAVALIRSLWD